MSKYQIGAFDALQWAWYMLRNYKDHPTGIDGARSAIEEVLKGMGKGNAMNFRDKIIQVAPSKFLE